MGLLEGVIDGAKVGWWVVGFKVGLLVAFAFKKDSATGLLEGLCVGFKVVGLRVGLAVNCSVGLLVALAVGLSVEFTMLGFFVGFKEGC